MCLTTLSSDHGTVVCALSDGSVSRLHRGRARLEWKVWVQRSGRVTSIAFNSHIVAAGGSDRSVALLDFQTGHILRYLDNIHQAPITDILVDGRR